MTILDDHTLMMTVRAGEVTNLAELFARHHVRLFNHFRRLGHGRGDAEDLVQDTFLRMLRYADSYKADGHFAAWMYGIARRISSDARVRPREASDEGIAVEPAAPARDEPHRAQAARELEQRLDRALARLSLENRELVLLSRVKDLCTDDLALLFNCSPGAVKVRLHRSLEQLRHYFEQTGGDPAGAPEMSSMRSTDRRQV